MATSKIVLHAWSSKHISPESTSFPSTSHTLCELLCMRKHSPIQTVVHPRRIVYLNKGYTLWAGEMRRECMHVGINKHTMKISNCEYMQLHKCYYTVYLCSEIHLCRSGQRQNCGKVRTMSDTFGASGNTSDTNTKHGLQEWVSVLT